MRNTSRLAVKIAGVSALAFVLSTSAFADSRHQDGTWRGRSDGGYNNSNRLNDGNNNAYRDNERVTVEGKVRSFSRERGGYRMQLDRSGYSFWVPESRMRNLPRGRNLNVGLSIRLGGIFRGGLINVDAVDWPGYGGYNDPNYGYNGGYSQQGYVSGYVDRIDFRRSTLWLRDNASGRLIEVDMRDAYQRSSRIGLDDLQRGDYVSLSGEWLRGGLFAAYRVDDVRTRRY